MDFRSGTTFDGKVSLSFLQIGKILVYIVVEYLISILFLVWFTFDLKEVYLIFTIL